MLLVVPALATERPPPAPDQPLPLTAASRIAALIEFRLPSLAAAIERDIPRRLATIHERVSCVHGRVLIFRVNARCDIAGYVERTGPVSLYGRGDHVIGTLPIRGTAAGQGSNRLTAQIHGSAEASATIEAEARPTLKRDWSLELNFSDKLRLTEAPYLHVLGRDIPLARYVERAIRGQLARLRARAAAEARALDLPGKAAAAWRQAFEAIKLSDQPELWLQMRPQSAAFAGVHASTKTLEGILELSGTAETFLNQAPPSQLATSLPPLATELTQPGSFEIILPLRISYDTLRQNLLELIAADPKATETPIHLEIYPSSAKIVVGLHLAKSVNADPEAGEWVYISGVPHVDHDKQIIRLSDLAVAAAGQNIAAAVDDAQLLARLREGVSVSYQAAYRNLLDTTNQRLTRTLKHGFRMEGHLTSATLDHIRLLSDGVSLALRASGDLKIIYGL